MLRWCHLNLLIAILFLACATPKKTILPDPAPQATAPREPARQEIYEFTCSLKKSPQQNLIFALTTPENDRFSFEKPEALPEKKQSERGPIYSTAHPRVENFSKALSRAPYRASFDLQDTMGVFNMTAGSTSAMMQVRMTSSEKASGSVTRFNLESGQVADSDSLACKVTQR